MNRIGPSKIYYFYNHVKRKFLLRLQQISQSSSNEKFISKLRGRFSMLWQQKNENKIKETAASKTSENVTSETFFTILWRCLNF